MHFLFKRTSKGEFHCYVNSPECKPPNFHLSVISPLLNRQVLKTSQLVRRILSISLTILLWPFQRKTRPTFEWFIGSWFPWFVLLKIILTGIQSFDQMVFCHQHDWSWRFPIQPAITDPLMKIDACRPSWRDDLPTMKWSQDSQMFTSCYPLESFPLQIFIGIQGYPSPIPPLLKEIRHNKALFKG